MSGGLPYFIRFGITPDEARNEMKYLNLLHYQLRVELEKAAAARDENPELYAGIMAEITGLECVMRRVTKGLAAVDAFDGAVAAEAQHRDQQPHQKLRVELREGCAG